MAFNHRNSRVGFVLSFKFRPVLCTIGMRLFFLQKMFVFSIYWAIQHGTMRCIFLWKVNIGILSMNIFRFWGPLNLMSVFFCTQGLVLCVICILDYWVIQLIDWTSYFFFGCCNLSRYESFSCLCLLCFVVEKF